MRYDIYIYIYICIYIYIYIYVIRLLKVKFIETSIEISNCYKCKRASLLVALNKIQH